MIDVDMQETDDMGVLIFRLFVAVFVICRS